MTVFEKHSKELEGMAIPSLENPDWKLVPLALARQKMQFFEADLKQKLAEAMAHESKLQGFSYTVELGENGVATVEGDTKIANLIPLHKVIEILHSL